MERPMMRCGCVANGTTQVNGEKFPCCVIHGTSKVADEQPDLAGRQSICPSCSRTKPSALSLPFFAHRPERETDTHYDGCYGWD